MRNWVESFKYTMKIVGTILLVCGILVGLGFGCAAFIKDQQPKPGEVVDKIYTPAYAFQTLRVEYGGRFTEDTKYDAYEFHPETHVIIIAQYRGGSERYSSEYYVTPEIYNSVKVGDVWDPNGNNRPENSLEYKIDVEDVSQEMLSRFKIVENPNKVEQDK